MDSIVHNPEPVNDPNVNSDPDHYYYYLSNPWVITICMIVGLVLLFNISMICYIQCSKNGNNARRKFLSLNKNNRKGYSNVAVDSEDISNSEMEAINVEE